MATVSVASDAEIVQTNSGARAETSTAQLPGGCVHGGRNEFICFQIVVAGPCSVTGVSVTPFGPFTASNIHVFTEWLLPLGGQTAGNNTPGSVPAIMWPVGADDVVGESRTGGLPLNIPTGQVRAWWVDLYVSPDAAPGNYTGTANVQISGQGTTTIPINATVWPYTVPAMSTFRSIGPVSYPGIMGSHPGGYDLGTALRLCSRYAQLALDHRYNFMGWDVGGGSLDDWNNLFGPLLDGTGNTQIKGAKANTFMQGGGWGEPSSLFGGASAFVSNAINRGWIDRLIAYTVDEPPVMGTAWAICPYNSEWKSLSSSIRSLVTIDIGYGYQDCIDIYDPIIEQFWPPGEGNKRGDYDGWLSGGSQRQVWSYQSLDEYNAGWLQYTYDARALQMRQMMWMEYLGRLKGDLFFNPQFSAAAGNNDTWNGCWVFGGNGGAWLFPGNASRIGGYTDIPLSSTLMKQIRQGVQDYERGILLDAAADNTMRDLGAQMFPSINTQPAIDVFLRNEYAIAQRISGGGGPADGVIVASVTPNYGPPSGRTAVTILGAAFDTGTTIKFGAIAANDVSIDSITQITCSTPPNSAGVVDVSVTTKTGLTGSLKNGFVYNAPPLTKSGPPLDVGYPVSVKTVAAVTNTVSVGAPSPATGPVTSGRLVYATLIWDTRNLANTHGSAVTDNHNNQFVNICSAVFDANGNPSAPGHQGAEIWAYWYANGVPDGTVFTATFGAATTIDVLFVVYSRYYAVEPALQNVTDSNGNIIAQVYRMTDSFGALAQNNDSSWEFAPLSVKLTGTYAGCTGVVAMQDGSGSGGIMPLDGIQTDAFNNPLTSMSSGTLLNSLTADGGDLTVGAFNRATFFNIVAAEILPSPQDVIIVPSIAAVTPASANVDGGDVVQVTGTGFLPSAQFAIQTPSGVTLGIANYINSSTYQFTVPAHSTGLVDLVYLGPDGQIDILSDALLITLSALQISAQDPNKVSGVGQGSKLTKGNSIYMVHGLQDLALKRLQDQMLGTLNPIISQVRQLPAATGGQFDVEPWASLTLLNDWVGPSAYSSGKVPPQPAFYKNPNGKVYTRGIVFGGRLGTVIAILPSGYRQGFTATYPTSYSTVKGAVVIDASGGIVAADGDPAKGISLDGISWRAEDILPGAVSAPYMGQATSFVQIPSSSGGTTPPSGQAVTIPDLDMFGVQEIYGELINGQQWFLNMTNPTSDTQFAAGSPLYHVDVDGSWNIQTASNSMYAYTTDGYTLNATSNYNRNFLQTQEYMQTAKDWRNVELTAVWHINTQSSNTLLYLQARGGKQNTGTNCESCGYRFVINPSSLQCYWQKQSYNGSIVSTPAKAFATSTPFLGHFIGMKVALRTLDANTVRLEGYIEPTGGLGTWVNINNVDDVGAFGGSATACGGSSDSMLIKWGGPAATFGWANCNNLGFRWLSVREIGW